MANLIRAALQRHPLMANSALYAVLYGSGETIQQLIQKRESLNLYDIRNVAMLGGCVFAPLYFQWYKVLDRILTGTSLKSCAIKTVTDMIVAGSSATAIFYTGYLNSPYDIDFLRDRLLSFYV